MAVTVLKNVSQDEINWYHESRYWMHVSDEKTRIRAATERGLAEGRAKGLEKGLAEGHAKGLAEGREKGLEEGLAKGLTEGRAEGQKEGRKEGRTEQALETAKKLLKIGLLSYEQIAESTNLSIKQIEELAANKS